LRNSVYRLPRMKKMAPKDEISAESFESGGFINRQ